MADDSKRNVLHNYVNYTYNLSLHALTIDNYNKLANSPTAKPVAECLIASGGRYAAQRNKHFQEDFFFEKLSMKTITGLNTFSRNSNALTLDFTIIEPMGTTLFNRLIEVCKDMGGKNITQMAYLIKIEFRGYNPDGTVADPIPNTEKIIPIQLLGIKLKINQKGSQYEVSAVPYNHSVFGNAVAATSAPIEVSARTVGDVFLTHIPDKTKKIPSGTSGDGYVSIAKENDTDGVLSYVGGLNKWHQDIADKAKTTGRKFDSYVFEMPASMANAELEPAKEAGKTAVNMPKTTVEAPAATENTTSQNIVAGFDEKPLRKMSFNTGTAIPEVIAQVLRNSSFLTKQLEDPNVAKKAQWFKIVPRINILEWDDSQNRNVKQYIYRIVPFDVCNYQNPAFPILGPDKAVKEYNYLFTGKNDDIIDLDLTFDALYYTSLFVDTDTPGQVNQSAKKSGAENAVDPKDPNVKSAIKENANLSKAAKAQVATGQSLFDPTKQPATGPKGDNQGESTQAEKVKAFQEQILSRPGGDMLSVKLKIIGDPEFIKQDDLVFWNTSGTAEKANGSLVTDSRQLFVKITSNSATDYDANGLAIAGSGPYSIGAFSGLYQVLDVDNLFEGGKFTQELNLVRHPIQTVGKGTNGPAASPQKSPNLQLPTSNPETAPTDQRKETNQTPAGKNPLPVYVPDPTKINTTPKTLPLDVPAKAPTITPTEFIKERPMVAPTTPTIPITAAPLEPPLVPKPAPTRVASNTIGLGTVGIRG